MNYLHEWSWNSFMELFVATHLSNCWFFRADGEGSQSLGSQSDLASAWEVARQGFAWEVENAWPVPEKILCHFDWKASGKCLASAWKVARPVPERTIWNHFDWKAHGHTGQCLREQFEVILTGMPRVTPASATWSVVSYKCQYQLPAFSVLSANHLYELPNEICSRSLVIPWQSEPGITRLPQFGLFS